MSEILLIKKDYSKRSISKKSILNVAYLIGVFVIYFFLIIIFSNLSNASFLLLFLLEVLLITFFLSKSKKKKIVFACFPIFLSCFQNVFLGLFVSAFTEFKLQVCLMGGFLFCFFYFLMNIKEIWSNQLGKCCIIAAIILAFYSLFLLLIFPTSPSSYVAGFRNLIGPFIFFAIGTTFYKRKSINLICDTICFFSIFVLLFGYFEILFANNIWISLNIGALWKLKGMNVASWGLPENFVSSEIIFGKQLRRMSSTFADPVNLGTFLFALLVICFYRKKYFLSLFSFVAIILTVSKGAMLGILFFVVVLTFFSKKYHSFSFIIVLLSLLFGLGFIAYSKTSSTGSLLAHFSGFINGLLSLLSSPFGLGIGNVGVVSTLFSSSLNNQIIESGFGTICGCLGWVGIFPFALLFLTISRKLGRSSNNGYKILGFSLLLSIIFNIMFNEVALSPNSCTIYFLFLGMLSLSNKESKINFYE